MTKIPNTAKIVIIARIAKVLTAFILAAAPAGGRLRDEVEVFVVMFDFDAKAKGRL